MKYEELFRSSAGAVLDDDSNGNLQLENNCAGWVTHSAMTTHMLKAVKNPLIIGSGAFWFADLTVARERII